MIDPIHQFNIDKIFTIGHIGNQEIAFTNSSAYMFVSVALISLLMIGGVAGRSRAFRKARKSGSAVVRNSGQPQNRD